MWHEKPAFPANRFRQKALGVRPVTAARLQPWHPARKLASRRAPPAREAHLNPSMWFRNPIARDTRGMGMPSAKNALEPAPLQNGPASRYEAVIRLGEAIRSHPDEKDLFRTLVNELHEVVEFDVLGQFDSTANWVQWYFARSEERRVGKECRS